MSVTMPDDVRAHLGRPPVGQAEADLWQVWIDGAEMMIADRLGLLAVLDRDRLVWVVAEAVAQKARVAAPSSEQVRRKTVTVDDGSVTKEYFDAPDNSVTIIDEWWRLLTPNARPARGAFTISPHYTPDRRRYCDRR